MPNLIKYSSLFEITPEPTILLTNPVGNSVYYVHDTVNITWTTTGTVGNITIQLFHYTTGIHTIVTNTPNDGSYSWTIQPGHLDGNSGYDFQLKIFETGIFGGVQDYCPDFYIYDYISKNDSIGFTADSVTTQIVQWQAVEEPEDNITFTADDISLVYLRSKDKEDSANITEGVSYQADPWLINRIPEDDISLTEELELSYLRGMVSEDSVSFTEGVSTSIESTINIEDNVLINESDVTTSVYEWIKDTSKDDSISFTDNVDSIITEWESREENDSIGIDEGVLSNITNWIHEKTDYVLLDQQIEWVKSTWLKDESDNIQFVGPPNSPGEEDVYWEVRQWAYVINDSVGISEDCTNVLGVSNVSQASINETCVPLITKPCYVREFLDIKGNENITCTRKTGWINSSTRDGRSRMIRRFNIEYHSKDLIAIRMFIDGNESEHVLQYKLPQTKGSEITNKSIRIGQRAKSCMFEIQTYENDLIYNSSKIEAIEIEVDD